MKKVLVTGATGFIGRYFVNYLLKHSCEVRALVRDRAKAANFPKEIEIITGDLTDKISLKNCCDDIDTVFHLGGYAHAWRENNPEFANEHHKINFEGTKNLFKEAQQSNVKKFIYFSSVKAVADSESPVNEDWSKDPDSSYGIAKRQAENFLLDAKNNKNMHICILRPALVYGPHWKGNLAAMLRAIDKGFFIPVPNIKNERSMISLEDICQAALLVSEEPKANGKIYFVTDGKYYSTRELFTAIVQALGKPVPKWHLPFFVFKALALLGDLGTKILRRRLPFSSETLTKLFGSAAYNSQRIQNEVGFKPIYQLSSALPEIVTAYRLETR
jgi:UDP-glucose 4-epimerase